MNQREIFLRHVAQTSDEPMLGADINITKASGSLLTDTNGKQYVDLISGISVSSIGHCHPKVVKAVKDQSEKYMHLMVYGEYNQKPQADYARLLCSLLPKTLDNVFFTTGGSEAVEGALKLAKRATGRKELIAFKNAYHGSTQGALSVMGNEYYKQSFRPLLPGIRFLEFNSVQALDEISSETAAVIIEPIQGEAGVRIGTKTFLKTLREKCDKHGVLLIFDEIQSGFGRTGTLFAFEHYQIVPDVLVIAKGMGGGLPIGAFVAPKSIMQKLSFDPVLGHINTFGGNALCLSAAKAALEVILEEKLEKRAVELEKVMLQGLQHPLIKEVRVFGALGAIEFSNEATCKKVIRLCIDKGIISDWFLFCPNAMRIAPPLNIETELLKKTIRILIEILNTLEP